MSLLSGLEKFGLSVEGIGSLFEDEEEKKEKTAGEPAKPVKEEPKESDFILAKSIRCPVCDEMFKTKTVKAGRARRLESDTDLRPRHEYIDTLQYDVCSCPYCGSTALTRFFSTISPAQIKLIRENVSSKFKKSGTKVVEVNNEPYEYEQVIDRYKLSLFNTVTKRGKNSEKAYECLKIAWIYRAMADKLAEEMPEAVHTIESIRENEMKFYAQAYEGMQKAATSEIFPICGMDQGTVTYLLAAMSYRLGNVEAATKYLGLLRKTHSADENTRRRAEKLRQTIMSNLSQKK